MITQSIDARMQALEITLPEPPQPSANFLPFVRYENLVQLSGVAPVCDDRYAFTGKVGVALTDDDGYAAARLCAMNLLANLRIACDGDLNQVSRFINVRGFVNAANGFGRIPFVINGASDLIVKIFGAEVGAHARTAVGCASLPQNVAVEIDALVML